MDEFIPAFELLRKESLFQVRLFQNPDVQSETKSFFDSNHVEAFCICG